MHRGGLRINGPSGGTPSPARAHGADRRRGFFRAQPASACGSWREAALLREGIGCGNMPLPLIQPDLASGALLRLSMPDHKGSIYRFGGIWRRDTPAGPGRGVAAEPVPDARSRGHRGSGTFRHLVEHFQENVYRFSVRKCLVLKGWNRLARPRAPSSADRLSRCCGIRRDRRRKRCLVLEGLVARRWVVGR
ncbi:hypothetical protein ACVMB3_005669 [Sinorhizobium meliloti]